MLLIANHFSWWDGFIQWYLNEKIFQRTFHVMMLEEQLKQHLLLRKGGAFSIKKNTKSLIESLNYCKELLLDKQHLVLLFPQGEIQSLYMPHFIFERGIEYLLKHINSDIQLIYNINLIDYGSEKKPTLYMYLKKYELTDSVNHHHIENDFNQFALECIQNQVQK